MAKAFICYSLEEDTEKSTGLDVATVETQRRCRLCFGKCMVT
jgi:hypothetical protein